MEFVDGSDLAQLLSAGRRAGSELSFGDAVFVGVEIAKAICSDCRATSPCLEYALAHRIEHGVWGGCSERQRRRILRDRRAAARSNGLVAVAA